MSTSIIRDLRFCEEELFQFFPNGGVSYVIYTVCHVLVHDWCLSPVVVECSAEAATNIRGILKVSEEAWSCRGHRQGQGHGPKGRRIWHLDELKVYGYGYHLHRELEAFLMPSWVPLEHDRIEPVVAEFCRMFAKPTENATRSGTTVETFSAEQRKSTDMARGYGGGGGSRSGRRNRWKRTKATARNQFIS